MFDIHQRITDKYDELDEDRIGKYIDGLLDEFAASSEAKPLLDEGSNLSDAGMMIEYAIDYLGKTPATMSPRDFHEVVFGLFPEKVSTPPENGPHIVAVLRAFWSFLYRQWALPNAASILKSLGDDAGRRLQAALADPANWGMAKSFVMQGMAEGYDMATQEGSDAFMAEYNRRLQSAPPPVLLDLPPDLDWDELPRRPSRRTRPGTRSGRSTSASGRRASATVGSESKSSPLVRPSARQITSLTSAAGAGQ